MSARKLVETRKVTVTYEIEARIYGDGTVDAERWTARDAAGWSRYVNEAVSPHIRAEAAVLRDLAIEAAPKPKEPKRLGFVGTVTTPRATLDVTAEEGTGGVRFYSLHAPDRGGLTTVRTWGEVLELGPFTPRVDAENR